MPNLSGKTFGKYELKERLGRGGMADVYKAFQAGLDRFVAVKVIHDHVSESEEFIVRFQREAQTVAGLRHQHILQVIDYDTADVDDDGDGTPYMVMEYIRGGTLKEYILDHGKIPADRALKITAQLADALEYAHQKGMVHRDIKPANIMFTDESHTHPVLTDFGIARILGETKLTVSGMMIGTPAYMSPEAGRGEKVDVRADIYSLGVVLYEMLVGEVPYNADTPYAVILMHINDPLPPPNKFGTDIPDVILSVLYKSLTKSPDDRYQTAAEFKTALEEALDMLSHKGPTAKAATPPVPIPPAGDAPPRFDTTPVMPQKAATQPPTPTSKISQTVPTPQQGPNWLLIGALGGALAIVIVALAAVLMLGGGPSNRNTLVLPTIATGLEAPPATQPLEVLPESDPEPEASDEGESDEDEGDSEAERDTVAEARGFYEDGLVALEDEDFFQASALLTRAVNLDDTQAEYHTELGYTQLQLDDAENAFGSFSNALALAPGDPAALTGLGEFYLRVEDYELALESFDRVIESGGGDEVSLYLRGVVHAQLEDYDVAAEDFDTVVEVLDAADEELPPEPMYLLPHAKTYVETERPADALLVLEYLIEIDDEIAEAFRLRAISHVMVDDLEVAVEDLRRYVALEPNDSEVFLLIGERLVEEEKTDAAVELYAEAIERFPTESLFYVELAHLHIEGDDFEAAIEVLRAGGQAPDPDPEIFFMLAEAYIDNDQPAVAVPFFLCYRSFEGVGRLGEAVQLLNELRDLVGEPGQQGAIDPEDTPFCPNDLPDAPGGGRLGSSDSLGGGGDGPPASPGRGGDGPPDGPRPS